MKIYNDLFDRIVDVENLFSAWEVFKSDKRKKADVLEFEWELEEYIFKLHRELRDQMYRHAGYRGFYISDPKQRHIHKASVRDRVLHHAVFSVINPLFEPTFITSSFSCRVGYGAHRGVNALATAMQKVSKNNTQPCFVLKCDVRKFFDSVDHEILFSVLAKRIKDKKTMWLLRSIIESYSSDAGFAKGIPIGNLTSQLFANIYMNEFDQFIKHVIKAKYYIRYTDDFAIVSGSRLYLEKLLPQIENFLACRLSLTLHPNKITLSKFCQGIDFLGYVIFPHHRLVRTKTRHRIFKKMRRRENDFQDGLIDKLAFEQSLRSYLGVLSHADAYHLKERLLNEFWAN